MVHEVALLWLRTIQIAKLDSLRLRLIHKTQGVDITAEMVQNETITKEVKKLVKAQSSVIKTMLRTCLL